jgi:tRNA(Glu) U13 pseudouridine synthase TruD
MLELSAVLLFATNLALTFMLGRSAFATTMLRQPVEAQ